VLTLATLPDLLRLLAVPAFGWAAWRDIRTRRVPNRTWLPLLGLGAVALVLEAWLVFTGGTVGPVNERLFLVRVLISLGFVVPLAYGFWWIGGFGGADAKALITIAVIFPTYPTYYLPTTALPLVVPTLGVFSMTVLSNTVVLGIAYPFVLMLRNLARGHVAKAMFVGRPIRWDEATEEYGRLLETPEGFSRRGLDLDALRMYLNWRGATLAELRADPETYRDPASLPADPAPPGDGSIPVTDGGDPTDDASPSETEGSAPSPGADGARAAQADERPADPWGAEAFLSDIDGSAYGTSPEQLREGLAVLTTAETVWITPGIPFLVPMFGGLLVGLVYGDVLFALLDPAMVG
jgi:preflagellin peptidase FlaK